MTFLFIYCLKSWSIKWLFRCLKLSVLQPVCCFSGWQQNSLTNSLFCSSCMVLGSTSRDFIGIGDVFWETVHYFKFSDNLVCAAYHRSSTLNQSCWAGACARLAVIILDTQAAVRRPRTATKFQPGLNSQGKPEKGSLCSGLGVNIKTDLRNKDLGRRKGRAVQDRCHQDGVFRELAHWC